LPSNDGNDVDNMSLFIIIVVEDEVHTYL